MLFRLGERETDREREGERERENDRGTHIHIVFQASETLAYLSLRLADDLRRSDLPRLSVPPSSGLGGVSLSTDRPCVRRGRRQGGGEQGSEGGAIGTEGGVKGQGEGQLCEGEGPGPFQNTHHKTPKTVPEMTTKRVVEGDRNEILRAEVVCRQTQ